MKITKEFLQGYVLGIAYGILLGLTIAYELVPQLAKIGLI